MSNNYIELLKRCLTAQIYQESRDKLILNQGLSWHPKKFAIYLLVSVFESVGIKLLKKSTSTSNLREEGRDWPAFGYTMSGMKRLDNVERCVNDILLNNVQGDLLEAGVWRGGVGILMSALLRESGITDRTIWLADSFQGLPKPSPDHPMDRPFDLSKIEYLKVSATEVRENFDRFGLWSDRVKLIEGWFKDTLHKAPIDKLALLRLDGDLYESTIQILESMYDKISPGGYVIIDDYEAFPVCKQAVHDFLSERKLKVEMHRIDWTAVYWKIPSDKH